VRNLPGMCRIRGVEKMKGFAGFPGRKATNVPVARAFFHRAIAGSDHLAELKLTFNIFGGWPV